MLLNLLRPGLNIKKPSPAISWIICMTPQRYEILKSLAMKSASCLPLRSSGTGDERVEVVLPQHLSRELCFER